MNISAVPAMQNSMAVMASDMKTSEVSSQMSIAILKQMIDNQKMVGDAITQMINATPSLSGTGGIVNIQV